MDGRSVVRRPIRLFAVCVPALIGAGGVAVAGSEGAGSDLERALAHDMNGGSAGTVTRAVECAAVPTGPGREFRCVLTSTRGTELVARVRIGSEGWTAAWEPLRG